MNGGSSASNLRGGGAFWRLVAAALATAIIVMMGSVGAANACPPGTASHHGTSKHKAKPDAVPASVMSVSSTVAVKGVAAMRHCCGGTSSSAGSSCKASCCSAGLAAIDVSPDGLRYVALPASYLRGVQSYLSSFEPQSRFRPPQIAA
jgi:hypothetical protein